MKTNSWLTIVFFGVAFLISGCGEENSNKQDVNLLNGAKAMDAIDESSKRIQERIERGDTLALSYKELEKFLPEISGFVKEGGASGNQMNVPGLGSWSQTEQNYSNQDRRIQISMADYNGSTSAFMGATALYNMGYTQEDDYKKSGSVDMNIKGVVAYETIYKQEQRAEMTLIVVDRFLVQINAEGTNDIEILKKVAASINLDKLTSY